MSNIPLSKIAKGISLGAPPPDFESWSKNLYGKAFHREKHILDQAQEMIDRNKAALKTHKRRKAKKQKQIRPAFHHKEKMEHIKKQKLAIITKIVKVAETTEKRRLERLGICTDKQEKAMLEKKFSVERIQSEQDIRNVISTAMAEIKDVELRAKQANALTGPATSTRLKVKSKRGKSGTRPATFSRRSRTLPLIPFKGGGGGGGGGGDIAKSGRALALKATSATQKSARSAGPSRRQTGGQTSQRVEPGSTRETFLSEMYTKIATARDKKRSSRSSRLTGRTSVTDTQRSRASGRPSSRVSAMNTQRLLLQKKKLLQQYHSLVNQEIHLKKELRDMPSTGRSTSRTHYSEGSVQSIGPLTSRSSFSLAPEIRIDFKRPKFVPQINLKRIKERPRRKRK